MTNYHQRFCHLQKRSPKQARSSTGRKEMNEHTKLTVTKQTTEQTAEFQVRSDIMTNTTEFVAVTKKNTMVHLISSYSTAKSLYAYL
jgi:hypothetical protein